MTRLLSPPSLIVPVALLVLAISAPTVLASGRDVIRDCTDDEVLSRTYTQQEYKDALAHLAADSDQYGNCRSVIKRAQLKALRDARAARDGKAQPGAGQSGGGGGASGGFGNPPASQQLGSASAGERAAIEAGRNAPRQAVNVAGAAVKPGIGSASDLPAPLLMLLALVLAGALALATIQIRALVLARRR